MCGVEVSQNRTAARTPSAQTRNRASADGTAFHSRLRSPQKRAGQERSRTTVRPEAGDTHVRDGATDSRGTHGLRIDLGAVVRGEIGAEDGHLRLYYVHPIRSPIPPTHEVGGRE